MFLPIDKIEKSDDEKTYLISGLASNAKRDLQGEIIDPNGIDASYLISDGYVDFEHDRDQVIGVPTQNTHVDSNGLFVEAKLFKNMPQVQDIIKLYHNIKDNGIKRNLGFSIEGKVLERDQNDDSIVRQVMVTGVAVTKNPANTDATWELVSKSLFSGDTIKTADTKEDKPMISMSINIPNGKKVDKALTAGHGITPATQINGAAFRTESLSGQLVSFAQNLKEARKIGLRPIANNVADLLAEKGAGEDAMVLFLQIFEGLSHDESQLIVQALNTNKLTNSRLEHILSGTDDITEDDD